MRDIEMGGQLKARISDVPSVEQSLEFNIFDCRG